jgi:hypothetical protein
VPHLEPYFARVREPQDRVLVEEASSCLATGARRAAYITLWLATAESLRRKFFEAQTFDGQAGKIVGEIQRREADHKAIDGLLISKAKEYGFVSDNEATRLQHLYENRNVYGHPYEQSPSDEAVLAAAADAVEIVLERPVALRQGYLDRQATRLTSDTSFLSDDQQAVEQHADLVRVRSAKDLHVGFVRKLVAALGAVFADPGSDLLQRRGVWFLRRFLLADPAILDEWDTAEDLPDHPTVLPRLFAVKELFELLSDHARDIVVNVLCQATETDPRHLALVWDLKEDGALAERNEQQLANTIAGLPLDRLSGSGLPLRAYWRRIVDELTRYSYDRQNEAIRVLRAVGPEELATLDGTAQEELGRNVMQAAERNAYSAVNLLGELTWSGASWPFDFLKGVAMEPVLAVDGQIRLKSNQMLRAMRTLSATDDSRRNEIIDAVRDGLSTGTIQDPVGFNHRRPEALEALATAAREEGLERISEIREALEAIEGADSGE